MKEKKETKIKKWEAIYGCILMLLFGFWTGFVFRGSGSWLIQKMLDHDFSINFMVIISLLMMIGIIIDIIVSRQNKE